MLNHAMARALSDGYQGLWATGDMSWEFGSEKDFSKLLEYEWQLEAFLRQHPTLSVICQYHVDTLPSEVVRQALLAHRALFINDTLSRLNPDYRDSNCFITHTNDATGEPLANS
jgi:MEDS: MEthanogen/methylotroph, DcmR Sensory domain